MTSLETDSPLVLAPRPSRRMWWLLFGLHAGALVSVVPLHERSPLLVVALALLVDLSLVYHWLRWRWPAVRVLVLEADGGWRLNDAAGRVSAARLLDSSVVLPALAILHFECEDGRRSECVLLGDSLEVDRLRRLRVRLRTRRGAREAHSRGAE